MTNKFNLDGLYGANIELTTPGQRKDWEPPKPETYVGTVVNGYGKHTFVCRESIPNGRNRIVYTQLSPDSVSDLVCEDGVGIVDLNTNVRWDLYKGRQAAKANKALIKVNL